jgi:hypothetical protein
MVCFLVKQNKDAQKYWVNQTIKDKRQPKLKNKDAYI